MMNTAHIEMISPLATDAAMQARLTFVAISAVNRVLQRNAPYTGKTRRSARFAGSEPRSSLHPLAQLRGAHVLSLRADRLTRTSTLSTRSRFSRFSVVSHVSLFYLRRAGENSSTVPFRKMRRGQGQGQVCERIIALSICVPRSLRVRLSCTRVEFLGTPIVINSHKSMPLIFSSNCWDEFFFRENTKMTWNILMLAKLKCYSSLLLLWRMLSAYLLLLISR